jgi:hypothetical protein
MTRQITLSLLLPALLIIAGMMMAVGQSGSQYTVKTIFGVQNLGYLVIFDGVISYFAFRILENKMTAFLISGTLVVLTIVSFLLVA